MRLFVAVLFASLCGYLALSHEILWIRVFNFATEARADAFGYLLAAYLAGLAFGSWIAGRICRRPTAGTADLPRVGVVLVFGALGAFLVGPGVAALVADVGTPLPATLPVFAAASAVLGLVFPLLCHFGIPPDERVGARLSYVYFGNIVGSALGSLITGLVLLDHLSLRDLNVLLAAMGVVLGAALMLLGGGRRVLAVPVVALAFVVAAAPGLYDELYEKLFYEQDYRYRPQFAEVIEGHAGVVTVTRSGAVYGGGSYEGIANVSPLPEDDENRVLRAYLVAAFHPRPREVLMIGLGSGSWLQVLANHPDIERLTVVEISPGFVEAVRRSALVASALDHPKVELVVDDGRRYLGRTARRFDLVIMNTIVYWRSQATLLLSREAMALVRRHLAPGGMLYLNTTMSTAVQKTAATAFTHAVRYQNMLIASDEPIAIDRAAFERKLDAWTIDGRPVLPPTRRAADLDLLREQDWRDGPTWEPRASILVRTQDEPIVTDDNMATEWWALGTYP